jgi:hypothetical protein
MWRGEYLCKRVSYRGHTNRFDNFNYPMDLSFEWVNLGDLVDLSKGNYDGFIRGAFGFERKSAQYNFLVDGPFENKFMLIVRSHPGETVGGKVYPFDTESIVAWVMGRIVRRNHVSCELWFVGVQRFHPFITNKVSNNGVSLWGHSGLEQVVDKGKVRWQLSDGTNILPTNFVQHVQGRANPYAVMAMYQFCKHAIAMGVERFEQTDLPCAKLFHTDYDHKTHPSIHLIYKALGFQYSHERFYLWKQSVDFESELEASFYAFVSTLTSPFSKSPVP